MLDAPAPAFAPFTVEDPPCPDPFPGGTNHWAGYQSKRQPDPLDLRWPFAVVMCKTRSTPNDLRKVGELLWLWKRENSHVAEIIGLDKLMNGEFPETTTEQLGIPGPGTIHFVALVLVRGDFATDKTGAGLMARMEGLRYVMTLSYEYYFVSGEVSITESEAVDL